MIGCSLSVGCVPTKGEGAIANMLTPLCASTHVKMDVASVVARVTKEGKNELVLT